MINTTAAEEAPRLSSSYVNFGADRFGIERRQGAAPRQDVEPVGRPLAVRKEYLPRRSGESRFAPPQYVYSASRGGAVPTESPMQSPATQAA